jgi:hypothetical protein
VPPVTVQRRFHRIEPPLGFLGIKPGQHFVPGPIGRHGLLLDARPGSETPETPSDPQQQPRRLSTRNSQRYYSHTAPYWAELT